MVGDTTAWGTLFRVAALGRLRTTGIEWPLAENCLWQAPLQGTAESFRWAAPHECGQSLSDGLGLLLNPGKVDSTDHGKAMQSQGALSPCTHQPGFSLMLLKGQSPFTQCCLVASHLHVSKCKFLHQNSLAYFCSTNSVLYKEQEGSRQDMISWSSLQLLNLRDPWESLHLHLKLVYSSQDIDFLGKGSGNGPVQDSSQI